MSVKEKMLKGLRTENKEYLINSFFLLRKFQEEEDQFLQKIFNEFQGRRDLHKSNGELSYCLEFGFQRKKYFIDATREYQYGFARVVNHLRNPNLKLFKPLKVETEKMPMIALATDIHIGAELFWDYFSPVNL